jgi:hypothetical protein
VGPKAGVNAFNGLHDVVSTLSDPRALYNIKLDLGATDYEGRLSRWLVGPLKQRDCEYESQVCSVSSVSYVGLADLRPSSRINSQREDAIGARVSGFPKKLGRGGLTS